MSAVLKNRNVLNLHKKWTSTIEPRKFRVGKPTELKRNQTKCTLVLNYCTKSTIIV
jgi:Pyruvate/2-oxoacid:ferredoxin oxidoreductase delta subunit